MSALSQVWKVQLTEFVDAAFGLLQMEPGSFESISRPRFEIGHISHHLRFCLSRRRLNLVCRGCLPEVTWYTSREALETSDRRIRFNGMLVFEHYQQGLGHDSRLNLRSAF